MKNNVIKFFNLSLALILSFSSSAFADKSSGCFKYQPNWELVDEYVHLLPNGTPTVTYPVGMYVSKNPAGKVYVSGVSIDTSNGQYNVKSIIRRSVNYGGNWSTSNLIYNSETGSAGLHFFEAPNGRLLYMVESHIYSSTNLASSFAEIANLSAQFPQYSNILLVSAVTKGNTIYMVGNAKSTINGFNNWRGLLFTSTNSGITWTLKKEFNKGDSIRTWLTSVVVKSSGKIAVGGYVYNNTTFSWLVEQSNSSVTSWSALETSLPASTGISYVRDLVLNSSEDVLALGPLVTSGNTVTYIRRYSSSAQTVYQSAPGLIGSDLFVAEGGNIFFPYTEGGVAKMAVSYNDGFSWSPHSNIDQSSYSYEMGEDNKNNLYMSSQDGATLKTYKLECCKSSNK